MLAALMGKEMIEAYGWSSVFIAAGVPVVLIPFVLKYLPESKPFLISKQRLEELKAIATRIKSRWRRGATPCRRRKHGTAAG